MAYIDIGGGSGGSGGGGLIPFAPVLLVAVAPVTPSGTHSIDGRSTGDLERVLLTAQADPVQNGIWLTDGAGTWQRPADLPAGSNAAFAFSFVQEGDVYANTGWANSTVPVSVVGTDPQQWVQVIAPGQLVANNGLVLTGSTLDVVPGDGSLIATPGSLTVGVLATDAQHGDRGGGTLHTVATDLSPGFMSAQDKAKLDNLPDDGVPATRQIIAGNGLIGGGDLSADRTLSVGQPLDGSIIVNPTHIVIGTLSDDSQHGHLGGGNLHASATDFSAGFMSAADKAKLDTVAAGATATPLTSNTPTSIEPNDAGVPGSGPAAAREDHQHAIVTGIPVSVTKAPNAEGVSTSFARSDHHHDVATENVMAVGTVNSEGTATSLARSDHVHDHGAQTVPTLHAVATPAAHGFLSATDKQKLDTVQDGAAASMVAWGSGAVSGTNTTRYLHPYYSTQLAPTSAISYHVPRAGTFRRMHARHNTPAGNGSAVVYTLRVNGVPTALAVSLASTATDASNLVNQIAVAAGDLVDIEVTKPASIATSPTDCLVLMEFSS